MMHEQLKCHDVCSNAVTIKFNKSQINKIGLSIGFLTKTPKLKNHLLNFLKQIDELSIT